VYLFAEGNGKQQLSPAEQLVKVALSRFQRFINGIETQQLETR